jgi:hypothetical protein
MKAAKMILSVLLTAVLALTMLCGTELTAHAEYETGDTLTAGVSPTNSDLRSCFPASTVV